MDGLEILFLLLLIIIFVMKKEWCGTESMDHVWHVGSSIMCRTCLGFANNSRSGDLDTIILWQIQSFSRYACLYLFCPHGFSFLSDRVSQRKKENWCELWTNACVHVHLLAANIVSYPCRTCLVERHNLEPTWSVTIRYDVCTCTYMATYSNGCQPLCTVQ